LDAYCPLEAGDLSAKSLRKRLADRLMALFFASQRKDWLWFENVLAYDNARLSQALIQTGLTTRTPAYVEIGLRSLRWLMSLQTTSSGHFRPVGSGSFGRIRHKPEAFDQQPVEAWATISACFAAWRANGDAEWPQAAMRAFGWFLGENDLQAVLVDPNTGSCSDGLHPDRLNENKGAESVLSYLLGLLEMRQFEAAAAVGQMSPAPKSLPNPIATIAPRAVPGSLLVSAPHLEPPDPVSSPGSVQGRRAAVQAGD
jgi:hypothetical protein